MGLGQRHRRHHARTHRQHRRRQHHHNHHHNAHHHTAHHNNTTHTPHAHHHENNNFRGPPLLWSASSRRGAPDPGNITYFASTEPYRPGTNSTTAPSPSKVQYFSMLRICSVFLWFTGIMMMSVGGFRTPIGYIGVACLTIGILILLVTSVVMSNGCPSMCRTRPTTEHVTNEVPHDPNRPAQPPESQSGNVDTRVATERDRLPYAYASSYGDPAPAYQSSGTPEDKPPSYEDVISGQYPPAVSVSILMPIQEEMTVTSAENPTMPPSSSSNVLPYPLNTLEPRQLPMIADRNQSNVIPTPFPPSETNEAETVVLENVSAPPATTSGLPYPANEHLYTSLTEVHHPMQTIGPQELNTGNDQSSQISLSLIPPLSNDAEDHGVNDLLTASNQSAAGPLRASDTSTTIGLDHCITPTILSTTSSPHPSNSTLEIVVVAQRGNGTTNHSSEDLNGDDQVALPVLQVEALPVMPLECSSHGDVPPPTVTSSAHLCEVSASCSNVTNELHATHEVHADESSHVLGGNDETATPVSNCPETTDSMSIDFQSEC